MAKNKIKKEPAERVSGSRFSRRRILVAALALVLLVGLSWVTLGFLKKEPKVTPKPKEPIATKVTKPVRLPSMAEEPSALVPEKPVTAEPTTTQPEPAQPQPAQPAPESSAAAPSAPEQPAGKLKPTADNFVLPKPKAPSLQEQTRVVKEMAENGKPPEPAATAEKKPTSPESKPQPSAETPAAPKDTSIQAKVPFQVLDQADIPSAQPPAAVKPTTTEPPASAKAPDITGQTGFPPPPETSPAGTPSTAAAPPPSSESGEKMVSELPRPKWQTMDKNWEKVEIEEAPPVEALKARDSNWRQMDVGQEETAKVEQQTPLPEAVKEPPPTEEAGSATGEKPKETPNGLTVASKTHKPVVKKTEPATAKPTHTAKASPSPKGSPTSSVVSGPMHLRIINETGRPGQGQVYRDVLAAMGYRVNKIEDRPAKSGPTTIMYGPGLRNQAVSLAERLPGKRSVTPSRDSNSNEIVIVVR